MEMIKNNSEVLVRAFVSVVITAWIVIAVCCPFAFIGLTDDKLTDVSYGVLAACIMIIVLYIPRLAYESQGLPHSYSVKLWNLVTKYIPWMHYFDYKP